MFIKVWVNCGIALGLAAVMAIGTGCVANSGRMAVARLDGVNLPPASAALQNAVGRGEVSGGTSTFAALFVPKKISSGRFGDALAASLANNGLLAPDVSKAKYALNAQISEQKSPWVGFDLTVALTVYYELLEHAGNRQVWSKTISTTHTAPLGDAMVFDKRSALAHGGAARKNIEQAVSELRALALPANQ